MPKTPLSCGINVEATCGLELMSLFVCVCLWVVFFWGANKDFRFNWGGAPKPNQILPLWLTGLCFYLPQCCVWPLPLCLDQQMWWPLLTSFLPMSVESICCFFPLSDPKLVEYFLIEHHRRAGGCSGHHYGVLCRAKHSIGRQKAISPPLKAPVMEVKWPVCSCLGKLNGWLDIVMLSTSADRQA